MSIKLHPLTHNKAPTTVSANPVTINAPCIRWGKWSLSMGSIHAANRELEPTNTIKTAKSIGLAYGRPLVEDS